MIEVETQTIEVEVVTNTEVTSTGQVEVETVDLSDLDITVAKKEYVITGDDIYIPMLYDDAPQWMKDLVQVVVDVSISSGNQSLINDMNAIIQDFAVSYVPLNQYTQSIIDLGDEDTRLNGLIETLNSNFNDGLSTANAQITSLQLTKASKDEVVAQVIQTIAAQLADGASNIGSTIGRIDQAIADETSARATSFQVLTSSLEDTNLDVTANATATSTLNTYVGLELGAPNGTGLLADVEILQKQNDGVIETTTGTYDVMISPENPDLAQLVITAEPYVTWKASDVSGIDTRLAHIGDVYVKYADTPNGAKEYIASYKFIRTVVDSTSPYATDSDGFTWALIVDQVAQDAYEQALNAYDLADNKRRVFTITPSGPYDIGDLWVRVVSGSNQIWKCQATREQSGYYNTADWSIASTDDTATVALQTGLADGTVTVKLTNAYVGTVPFTTYIASEIDGKVGVYSGETAPVAGQPSGVAANDIYLWFTTASKVLANGTTQVYDITRTYKYSGSAWNEITTDSNITALADLADGKRTVFSGNTVPVGAVARDIWIPSATNGSYLQGEIYQYNGTAWVVATKYTEDLDTFIDVTYIPTVTSLQNQVDGKIESWYTASTSDPKSAWTDAPTRSKHDGDMWYQTDTKLSYYYSSSTNAWNLIDDAKAIQALADAATAQATADGKISSYYMATLASAQSMSTAWTALEKTNNVGDLVVIYNDATLDNNGTWRWNGSSWETTRDKKLVSLASDVTTLSTNLQNGTGTWATGDSNVTNSLTTTINNKVATVESKWAYNSIVGINGVYKKSGFGLTTNYVSGSGTQVDPYISEFWIDASRLKFTNSNVTGSVAPFTIDASGTTPQITFNGIVSFSNVSGTPATNKTYVQSSQPTSGMNVGDTWIDSDNNNNLFTYNGTTWIPTQSGAKVFYQPAQPLTGMVSGDIWIDIDANYKQYVYNGTTWGAVLYDAAVGVNNGTTTINGGKITTGSITANQIQANSVSADRLMAGTNGSTVWTGGGLVSSNFNGNPVGVIGSPTSGFRLSSNSVGNSSDPNIYGAYIRGSTIAASALAVDSLKIETAVNTFAPLSFASVASVQNQITSDYSLYLDTIFSPVYAGGYYNKRVSSYQTPINLFMNCFIDVGDVTCLFEVSYNGGGWGTVDTRTQNGNGNSGFTWSTIYVPEASWSYLQIRFRFAGSYMRSASCNYLVINGS